MLFSDKIQDKKIEVGIQDPVPAPPEPDKPLSAIEDFCERFDRAVRKNNNPGQKVSLRMKENSLKI